MYLNRQGKGNGIASADMALGAGKLMGQLWRMVLAVLLTCSAFSPALAQFGCVEDALIAAPGVASDQAAAIVSAARSSDDEGQGRPADKVLHCAFSHCSHLVAPTPVSDEADEDDFSEAAYPAPLSVPLFAAPSDGPYHPPRA